MAISSPECLPAPDRAEIAYFSRYRGDWSAAKFDVGHRDPGRELADRLGYKRPGKLVEMLGDQEYGARRGRRHESTIRSQKVKALYLPLIEGLRLAACPGEQSGTVNSPNRGMFKP